MKRSEIKKILKEKFGVHNKFHLNKINWAEQDASKRPKHQQYDYRLTVMDYDYEAREDSVDIEYAMREFFKKERILINILDTVIMKISRK